MLSQRKALVFVTLLLLCCALLNTRWTRWLTRPVSSAVETLVIPADWVASSIGDAPQAVSEARTDEPLDEQLTQAKRRLEIEQALNSQLWQENERLRQQIKEFDAIVDTLPVESIKLVGARVARSNSDPVNPTMKLLRGSLHGLKPEDAVVFEADLIGFVTDEIAPMSSTVSLINRPGFEIEINVVARPAPESDESWIIRNRAAWSDDDQAFICEMKNQTVQDYVRLGNTVRVNDAIRDSANGFVLGEIAEIQDHEKFPLQLRRVVIRPRTAIGAQRMVTVLTERND